ncbi:MAG: ATP-dependent helicase [Chloroflexi bacterium]|nr:ATP-dependent helicase [Chloroflexota bacterium]
MSVFLPNPGQDQAIHAPLGTPTRVVAGAGTGKTEVISRRFVHLLEQDRSLRPENILVLTFSEKAAAEMRARIFRAVTQADLGFDRLDLSAASISTFHSFGARLLREHSLAARVDPNLPVLTPVDVQEFMEEAQERFLEEGYREAYGTVNPLELGAYTWEDGGPFATAQEIMDQLLNQGVAREDFKHEVVDKETESEAHRTLAPLVHWLYAAYLQELKDRGQLDFDRLIVGAVALLENDKMLRDELRTKFKVILVDEYQDTNFAQDRLLRALAAEGMANVTVVGDPRQAIYVWREARVNNIADFPMRGGKRNDRPLIENRRSLKPILDVANRAIAGYAFGVAPEFDAHDELKPYSKNEQFDGVIVDLQACPTREEEAEAVAGWIAQVVTAEDLKFGDIAILIRARTYLDAYTAALRKAGIPYEVSAQDAFFTRPEVLDAIHLLNVCLNPADDLSLVRVLLSPAVGLSQDQVAALARAREKGERLWGVVRRVEAATQDTIVRARVGQFMAFRQESQKQQWVVSMASFVDWALQQSGLGSVADPLALRALTKLQAIVQVYESDHPTEYLRDLVTYLRLTLEGDPRAKAPELNTAKDAVRVLTAHASKGLEFPMVIAADSRQKVRPNQSQSPFHEPSSGLVIPKEEGDHPAFVERKRRTQNEARCLWYVTCTRAKKRLIITATNKKEREDERYGKVETFFEELWNRQADSPLPGVALDRAPEPKSPLPSPSAAGSEPTPGPMAPVFVRAKREFHVSPTAFRWYQQCPAAYRYYYLTRYGRLKEDIEREEERVEGHGTGRLLGSVFHRAVAAHARYHQAAGDELLGLSIRESSAHLTASQANTVKTWLELYLASEIGRVPPEPAAVEVRVSLTTEFDDGILRVFGVADRFEPDRLIDFKTDIAAEGLVDRYGDQLRLYALAAKQDGLLKPEATLWIFHAPTAAMLPVSCASADETRLQKELANFTANLARPNAAFPQVKSDLCEWCAARTMVCAR